MKQRILGFLAALLLLPGLVQAKVFLVDTNDTVRVVTASAVTTIHMYASWADLTTTALTPGASDAQVTTATTTVLVAAPGASTQRQLKGLTIRNAHASSSNVITIEFFNGTTATQLIQYTLLAGETLQWGEDENFRVIDASGQVKGAVVANAGTNLNTSALLTTTAHDAAFGTAGTPDAQVRSVQGIPSMTPFLVNPGTATNFGVYAEDSVHASGDNLILAGAVQQSTDAALAGDGDRTALQVDATGYLKVVNKNPNLAADNSTNSTAKTPVLPGTVSTSAPTWTSGNQSALSLQTDGSVRAAITNTPTVTANAGTNLNTSALLTTSAHDAAFGTAGTADTQVRSVQGISGMTPIQVQSNSANLATAALQDGIIKDGTGDTTQANVSSGSLHVACQSGCSGGTQYAEDTAHVSGDTVTLAGVVQQSATAALAGDGDRTLLQVDQNGHLKVVNANPNLAADNSTNSTSKVPVLPGTVSTAAPTLTTGNQSSLSIQTDGSVRAAITNGVTVSQATGTNLHMVCDSGCSSSAGFSDNGAFTFGTTAINPIGGVLDDTATNAATENSAAVARITAQKALHMNLRNVSGTEVGTSGAPLRIDPTGTTTQPVSGTVSITANSAVNVAQINGVATSMGNGVSGTGVQRVTIASDSTGTIAATQATAANLNVRADTSGATGAAPPARAEYVGGLASGATGGFVSGFAVCDSFANVNVTTATTTALITGVSGRHVRICGMSLVTAAANNVALISGTGATCGTGTTGMSGGTTAAAGWNFAANGGLTQGSGLGVINQTNATGDSVCIVTSAATQLSGRIAYAIY